MALSKDKYIIHHGIALAENSYIVNCEIEVLSQDPTPLRIARLWYNSTDKKFKYSGLNQNGDISIQTFDSFGDVTLFIESLASIENGQGSNLIGYEGVVTSGLVIPPSSVKTTLDILTQEINNLKNSINNLITIDEFIVDHTGFAQLELSKNCYNKNKMMVLINGLEQSEEDYELNNTSSITSINLDMVHLGDKIKIVNFEIL